MEKGSSGKPAAPIVSNLDSLDIKITGILITRMVENPGSELSRQPSIPVIKIVAISLILKIPVRESQDKKAY